MSTGSMMCTAQGVKLHANNTTKIANQCYVAVQKADRSAAYSFGTAYNKASMSNLMA